MVATPIWELPVVSFSESLSLALSTEETVKLFRLSKVMLNPKSDKKYFL
jgi:hypothetical protein